MKYKLNQPDVEVTTTTTEYNINFSELKAYVDKKFNEPTLEQVKKEWEELGCKWVFSNDNNLLDIFDNEEYSVIKIDIKNKKFIKVDSVIFCSFVSISFKEHQLLTKTFKALGW